MRHFIEIRKIITAFLTAALVIVMAGAAVGADDSFDYTWDVWTVSDCVYMADISGEHVFYEKNAYSTCYPASTIKALTCLLAVENSSLDETVTFSERAVTLEEGYTMLPAYAGEEMSMRDCLYAMMVMSANECANAVAEHIGGSIEGFAAMMNERAAAMGCENSHFTTPYGGWDPDHYSTSYDMFLIAREAFGNPAVVQMAHTHDYVMAETNYCGERYIESKNLLFSPDSEEYNPAVLASKSGNLETGRCLITLAELNGVKVIVVCMHSSEYYGVFSDTNRLLNYVYENTDWSKIEGPEDSESIPETESSEATMSPEESETSMADESSDETDMNENPESSEETAAYEETGHSEETEAEDSSKDQTEAVSVSEGTTWAVNESSTGSEAEPEEETDSAIEEGSGISIWPFIIIGVILAAVCALSIAMIRRKNDKASKK